MPFETGFHRREMRSALLVRGLLLNSLSKFSKEVDPATESPERSKSSLDQGDSDPYRAYQDVPRVFHLVVRRSARVDRARIGRGDAISSRRLEAVVQRRTAARSPG